MKLCYQVATPDVAIADSVTAYQGPLDKTFGDIAAYGYDGVELMTIDPGKLNWEQVRRTAQDLAWWWVWCAPARSSASWA